MVVAKCTMELGQDSLAGLRLFGEEGVFGSVQLKVLWSLSFKILLRKESEAALYEAGELKDLDGAKLRLGYSAATSAIIEGVRKDIPASDFGTFLEDCGIPSKRSQPIATLYADAFDGLREILKSIGFAFPKIVDVEWRLDYYLKSNTMDKINVPCYIVTLKTNDPSGKSDLTFHCTQEQLHDLTSKFKDATKQIERIVA